MLQNNGGVEKQEVLLLHDLKQKYALSKDYLVPKLKREDELLIKVQYIGLNPIDWKAPDYGFGIPTLPYIAGRDLVGVVIKAGKESSRIKTGDVVFSASTDYRDLRKATYQQYAVASESNVCRIPEHTPRQTLAGLGVAYVAAALALGVCLGADFSTKSNGSPGPNIRNALQKVDAESIPQDVRKECLDGMPSSEVPSPGDWIAIWGGSSASAGIAGQLSKSIGLRVIKVVDVGKHGELLSEGPADLLVDNADPQRAIEIIRKVTRNNLRFAIDTIGKETATHLQKALRSSESGPQAHLVGLTGLPKETIAGVKHHVVPIKINHEIRAIGESLMTWLETLLLGCEIQPPKIEVAPGGLEGINNALDRMRKGEIAGKRLVVKLD
ncbi:GroES-like protein [Tothia fuscella]|uniref:GroES-like protein n=1 Tax=Tothia fuscella TaxID=1048955 RepID=A0A9P4U4H5_9PEZI|nr:GroES-like protein [Tothia fuscella]